MATSTASETQPQDPLLGKAVGGRYTIERLIGRGGVGLVYLAEDKIDGSEVVVKVLAPHWAEDRDAVARFDREALRMAKLKHPNVVEMYDHGHFEGRAFIVMEFIRGEPLRRYLSRRKRMPLEEFVPIAAQILAGAGYVHERGIMMRDIKPPNIMLCEQGGKSNHVKLLDFGLAKLIEEDEDDEVTKAHVIGTAAYMSPEQIKGEKIDVRVDVYALGVLFFLMLTGEQPIAGDNDAAVLVNHVHGTPKPLTERLPTGHRITPELIALVESCLAKSPADRPANAGAMGKRLREILPAALFELPSANLKSRAPAESYWAARLHSGPAAVAALESDGNDSAEWTRPLLRRAAKTGESPLKLAEAEIAAMHAAHAKKPASGAVGAAPKKPGLQAVGSSAVPQAKAGSGSGAVPRPKPPSPGSSASAMPRPPSPGSSASAMPRLPSPGSSASAMPRPTTGSGAVPRPKPPSPGSSASAMPRPTTGSGAVPRPKPPAPPPPPGKRPPSTATPMSSPPSSATVRVTAADAKEAVAKLEDELDAARSSNMRTLIPTTGPATPPSAPSSDPGSDPNEHDALADRPTLVPTKAPSGAGPLPGPTKSSKSEGEPDAASSDRRTLIPTKAPSEPAARRPTKTAPVPTLGAASEMAKTGKRSSVPAFDPAELDLDAEDSSDVMPIVFDDEVRPSESIAPTLSSDPVATDALSVLKPIPLPPQLQQPATDGMRWGAFVALAGLLALSLGGLSAYLILGDDDDTPSTPATSPSSSPVAEVTPPAKGPAEPSVVAEPETPPASGSGRVEVRALAGARVEVDGEDRGEAPVPLDLPVGEHRVRVTAPAHHPWQTTIDVKAGANAAVTAELVPMAADAPPPEPKGPGETKRPKPGSGKSKPDTKTDASKPEPKDPPKSKPDVFMDSSKGKDDGIFLPVGGK